MITEEKFDKFTVYKDTEKHQFCYVTIKEDSFYNDFASYLLEFSTETVSTRRKILVRTEISTAMTRQINIKRKILFIRRRRRVLLSFSSSLAIIFSFR